MSEHPHFYIIYISGKGLKEIHAYILKLRIRQAFVYRQMEEYTDRHSKTYITPPYCFLAGGGIMVSEYLSFLFFPIGRMGCIYIYNSNTVWFNFQTYIIFSINLVSFGVTLRSSGTDILYGCHLLLDVCIIYFISCDCIVNNSSLSYPIY